MTPLSWRATKEKIQKAIDIGLGNITVDFTILYGKRDYTKSQNII